MTRKKQPEEKLGMEQLETREVQGHVVCDATEAARVLGVSRLTVMNYMERGYIQFFTLPSGVRKPLADSVRACLYQARGKTAV